MEMVNKIPFAIRRVVPGTVCVLRFDNEIQMSFRDFQVLFLREIQSGPREKKCTVSTGIDDPSWLAGFGVIRATGGGRRGNEIVIVVKDMLCDRPHYVQPLLAPIDLVNLQKGLIHVWHGSYKRSSFSHRAPSGFPIERISPTIVRVAWAPAFFQNFKEMSSAQVVLLIAESP